MFSLHIKRTRYRFRLASFCHFNYRFVQSFVFACFFFCVLSPSFFLHESVFTEFARRRSPQQRRWGQEENAENERIKWQKVWNSFHALDLTLAKKKTQNFVISNAVQQVFVCSAVLKRWARYTLTLCWPLALFGLFRTASIFIHIFS